MGWKYRIFFRPVPGAGPVFTSKSQASVEERKDVYHPHSAAVGVKERGVGSGSLSGVALEMKVRKDVDEQGFEKWKKHKFSGAKELSQALLQGGHEQLASLSQPAATVVTLAKRRRQHGSMAVTTEETELQVMPSTRLNADQGGPTAKRTAAAAFFDGPPADQAAAEAVLPAEGEAFEAWRSVAIEGKRKACTSLLATVPAACRALAQGGEIIVCGYPEFVCAIAQRYEASALGQQQRRALREASFSLKAARQDGDASSSAAAAGPNRAAVNRAETERCAPCTPPGEEGCAVS